MFVNQFDFVLIFSSLIFSLIIIGDFLHEHKNGTNYRDMLCLSFVKLIINSYAKNHEIDAKWKIENEF
jgi:hypothetical protein